MWLNVLGISLLIIRHSILVTAAPTSSDIPLQPHVEYTSSNPNTVLWGPDSNITPEPIRNNLGAPLLGPHNVAIELQNADLLAPPTTDNGNVQNYKWPMSASHTKLKEGGWTRQQNSTFILAPISLTAYESDAVKLCYSVNEMPIAKSLAGK
jgi:hypothetical protein